MQGERVLVVHVGKPSAVTQEVLSRQRSSVRVGFRLRRSVLSGSLSAGSGLLAYSSQIAVIRIRIAKAIHG